MMSRFSLYSELHCSLVQSCIATFSRLGLSLIIVPVVAIIDAAAIAKAFGENHIADDHDHNTVDQANVNLTKNITAAGGKPVDVNQEMLAVGWTNIFGSFVQAIPVTHSLSR